MVHLRHSLWGTTSSPLASVVSSSELASSLSNLRVFLRLEASAHSQPQLTDRFYVTRDLAPSQPDPGIFLPHRWPLIPLAPPTCSAQETPSTWLRLCFRAQLAPQPLTAFGPGVQQGVQPLMPGRGGRLVSNMTCPGPVPHGGLTMRCLPEEALKGGQAVWLTTLVNNNNNNQTLNQENSVGRQAGRWFLAGGRSPGSQWTGSPPVSTLGNITMV